MPGFFSKTNLRKNKKHQETSSLSTKENNDKKSDRRTGVEQAPIQNVSINKSQSQNHTGNHVQNSMVNNSTEDTASNKGNSNVVATNNASLTYPSPRRSDDHSMVSSDASSSNLSIASFASNLTENAHRQRWEIHDSITDCIGLTPIVRLQKMAPPGVNVYVKLENTNPGGSLKDRLALGVIEYAEKMGELKPGQTVVEASSGNTGIGLAMVCASKGYPFVCVMSENYSIERRKLMRFLGARVILTKKEHKATGMVIKAEELAKQHGYFYARQFENEANAWIHEQTTAKEIIRAFEKENITLDHFFMSYGSGGTLLGVSRALRRDSPHTRIHVCEPANAPMLQSGIPTQYPKSGFPSTSFRTAHPIWSPHQLQGWATDFIPKLASKAQKENGYDDIELVRSVDAIRTSRMLAVTEGIFCGISGGGILASALEYAETCAPGENILAVITDTGERYLSTELFDSIPAEMTEAEQKLYDSTPSRAPPPPPAMHGIFPANTDELFDL